jgi:hypothetical protein
MTILLATPLSGQQPQTAQNDRPETAPTPWQPTRLADGQPDVQGVWRPVIGGSFSLTSPMTGAAQFRGLITGKMPNNPSRIVDPPSGTVPYQPWAAALQKQQEEAFDHPARPEQIDTQSRCLMGVPRLYYLPAFHIIQAPGAVLFVWEDYHYYRYVPLDGRPHPGPGVKLWMGDARGHWEGNTLVVDTTNINGKSRISVLGDFISAKAHLVERMTFVDAKTLNYEVTIDDPDVFTRPWTMRVVETRGASDEIWEFACHEGEHNAAHLASGIK